MGLDSGILSDPLVLADPMQRLIIRSQRRQANLFGSFVGKGWGTRLVCDNGLVHPDVHTAPGVAEEKHRGRGEGEGK